MNFKWYSTTMITSIVLISTTLGIMTFLQQPQFGKAPSGKRLEKIQKSPNYRNGQFQNLNETPTFTKGVSYYAVMKDMLFNKNKKSKPETAMPSTKIDLLSLKKDTDVLVWFGHSSYFMQIDGKRFLVDPVLCGSASPIKATMRSFDGSDVYSPNDIPEIDYLLISHDHWDHLDYETLTKLKPKIKHIITGLGVGAHLEHWGFDSSIITEKDWYDEVKLDSGFTVTVTPSRHFSGRLFKRNQTLWVSFVVKTPNMNLFLSGDGGFDTHFEKIGKKFGPFDLAILECGQYNKNWRYIHLMPEEAVIAAQNLQAKRLLPVHWGKFKLSNHDWDEPIKRISAEAKKEHVSLTIPMIGNPISLKNINISESSSILVDAN